VSRYSFDNAWVNARQRLLGIEARYDPGTIRHLETIGVGDGWHCLEIGGGGGSIAEWLCRRVGPRGRVVATDVDTRFLEALDYANLEVRKHNIVTDALPQGACDLIHTRMVLEHVPEREAALPRMVSALKPGGWLLCEGADNLSATPVSPSDPASRALYTKVENAVWRVMADRGLADDFGRRLYGLLRAQGLTEVQVEGRVALRRAGETAEVARLTVEQLREDIVNAKYATEAEIEAYVALLHDPAFVAVAMTLFAVWGRRAEGSPADAR
jgi:SAM-dependent methyltransferase